MIRGKGLVFFLFSCLVFSFEKSRGKEKIFLFSSSTLEQSGGLVLLDGVAGTQVVVQTQMIRISRHVSEPACPKKAQTIIYYMMRLIIHHFYDVA